MAHLSITNNVGKTSILIVGTLWLYLLYDDFEKRVKPSAIPSQHTGRFTRNCHAPNAAAAVATTTTTTATAAISLGDLLTVVTATYSASRVTMTTTSDPATSGITSDCCVTRGRDRGVALSPLAPTSTIEISRV